MHRRIVHLEQLTGVLQSVIDACCSSRDMSPSAPGSPVCPAQLRRVWSWPTLRDDDLPTGPFDWQLKDAVVDGDQHEPLEISIDDAAAPGEAETEPRAEAPCEPSEAPAAANPSDENGCGDDADGVLPEAVFAAAGSAYDMQVVRSHLQAGGDINAQDASRGWTLLMAASVYDHKMLVMELLQRGANTEVRQHYGCTALAVASMRGSQRAVELLVDASADVNAADHMGVTPFMSAVTKGHKRIAELLLRAGARSVTRDESGYVTRVKRLDLNPRTASNSTTCSSLGESSSPAGIWGVQRSRVRRTESSTTGDSSNDVASRPGEEEHADLLAQQLIDEEAAEKGSQASGHSSQCSPQPRASGRKRSSKHKKGVFELQRGMRGHTH